MTEKMNLSSHIRFLGSIDYDKAMSYIAHSDIGLIPHHVTESWNTTLPNKLFDYMSMGKAVIVSNAAPAERIVKEEKCGVVFHDRDPDDLARAILALASSNIRE